MTTDDDASHPPAASPDGVAMLMAGFPPAPESQVTLANWQDPPFNRWAFRHMRELIPSHAIPAGPPAPLPVSAAALDLSHAGLTGLDGGAAAVEDVLAGTYTDAFLVVHDGQVVAERYYAGMTAGTGHLVMSVSKSILSCVAGVLTDRGLLDLQAPVTAYVPEVEQAPVDEHGGHAAQDRLRHRHDQVPGARGHARVVPLGHDLPVVHDQERVGVGAGQHVRHARRAAVEPGDRRIVQIQGRAGGQRRGRAGRDRVAGNELAHVPERPAVERGILPIGQRDL